MELADQICGPPRNGAEIERSICHVMFSDSDCHGERERERECARCVTNLFIINYSNRFCVFQSIRCFEKCRIVMRTRRGKGTSHYIQICRRKWRERKSRTFLFLFCAYGATTACRSRLLAFPQHPHVHTAALTYDRICG